MGWTYASSGGLDYPVEPGEIWRVGAHQFLCSDLMLPLVEEWLSGQPVDLLYCDPPWNTGQVNAFRTKAGMPRADYRWIDLYRRVISLVPPTTPIFIEGGVREADLISELLPGVATCQWDITYNRSRPAVLHYSGPDESPTGLLDGLDDEDLPYVVLSSYPRGLVLDPCAGRGLTSRAAENAGWRSLNNELNPNRISSALRALAKMTRTEPEKE